MQHFQIITITYKTASLKEVGNFVIPDDDQKDVLGKLKEEMKMGELFYLSTCNRVTFFFTHAQNIDREFMVSLIGNLKPCWKTEETENHLSKFQVFGDEDAIMHLFSVASSLDSLVLGEREIIRQLRLAYERCHGFKFTGDQIRLAIEWAIKAGKKVYSHTGIGEKPVSVASLAVRQLLAITNCPDTRFLIVGSGQTNQTVTKLLLKFGFRNFEVFNRTLENARALAEKIGGKAHGLHELAEYRNGFDVIFTCTGTIDPVITEEIYGALTQNDDSEKIIIDLAIPADVDSRVIENCKVRYIGMEQLQTLIRNNMDFRQGEIIKAQEILNTTRDEFFRAFEERRASYILRELPVKIENLKHKTLNDVFRKELESMDADSRLILEKVVDYLGKNYVSIPHVAVKEMVGRQFK